jgi:predicted XRE-type DNA-binding protein
MLETIESIPSLREAILYSIRLKGLSDKQVSYGLAIDQGQWSRIKNGHATFDVDKLITLFDLCGNYIPLYWLAHHCGKDMQDKPASLEEQIKQKEAALLKLREENERIKNKYNAALDVIRDAKRIADDDTLPSSLEEIS